MVIKYQWRCDGPSQKLARIELQVPLPLKDVLTQAAADHNVSRNAFIVGLLHWMSEATLHKRLRIETDDFRIKVTELIPGLIPGDIPLQYRK